jgi:hypothetical protein
LRGRTGYADLLLVPIGAGAWEGVNALGELYSVFRLPVESIGFEDSRAILVVKPKHFTGREVSRLGVNPESGSGKRMPDDVEAVHPDWLRIGRRKNTGA